MICYNIKRHWNARNGPGYTGPDQRLPSQRNTATGQTAARRDLTSMWHGLLAGIGFSVGLSIGVPLLFLFGLVVVVLYSKMFRRSDRVEDEEPSQNDD
jgi:hypothetical protein